MFTEFAVQKLRLWLGHAFALFAFLYANLVYAQSGPSNINISGVLFDASGAGITSASVNFKIEIYDKGATCLIYTEDHLGVDLSQTKGGFSIDIGSGSSIQNLIDSGSPAAMSSKVYENPGVIAGGWAGCPSGATLANGDSRVIRIKYDLGGGYVAMNPDVPIASAAYATVAQTLQGKRPSDFIQVHNDVSNKLTQANVENVFSATNYPKLTALLGGSSTDYMSSNPSAAVGFNNQRITNLADPSAATDAATKNYADSYLGGKSVDVSGVGPASGDGYTLIWDKAAGKWTTGMPTATDNTKLPLAGGTMTGTINFAASIGTGINLNSNDLLATGHITMSPLKTLTLGAFTDAQETTLVGTLTAANAGASWYNTTSNTFKIWNGSAAISQTFNGATAGGDLTGTYPNPTIANDKITSAKVDSAGIGLNRLVISDQTTGANLKFATCAANEVLRYEGVNGWTCRDPSSIVTFPVTSVNSKTGAVVLNANDLGLGTASLENVGTGAGDIPQLDAGGKIPSSMIPAASAPTWGDITNAAGKYMTYKPNNTACGNNELLKFDGTNWICVAASALGLGDFMKDGSVAMTGDFNAGTHNLTAVGSISGSSLSLSSTGANNGITLTPNGTGLVTTSSALRVTPTALPGTPAAGTIAFDSGASNALKFYDGSAWQTVGTGTGNGDFKKDGSVAMTGDFDGGTHNITNIGSVSGSNVSITSTGANNGITLTPNGTGLVTTSSALRVTPTALPASPAAGVIAFDSGAANAMKYYDGSAWVSIGSGTGDFLKNGSVAMTGDFDAGTHNLTNLGTNITGAAAVTLASGGTSSLTLTSASGVLNSTTPLKITPAALPGTPAAGTIAFDSGASNALKFYDGSAWQTVGTGTGNGDFKKDGSVAMTGDFDGGTHNITNIGSVSGSNVSITSTGANNGITLTPNGTGLVTTSSALLVTPTALPASPAAGVIAFDSGASNILKYYNGSAWQTVNTSNATGDFMKDGSVAMTGDFNAGTKNLTNIGTNINAAAAVTLASGGTSDLTLTSASGVLNSTTPLKITPTALPGTPAAGMIAFDSGASNALKFYDGSAWQTVGTGTGSGDFKKDGSVAMTGNFNAGGNSVLGNTTASANLKLESTSDATKGYVLIQPNGGNVGIGTTSASGYNLYVSGQCNGTGCGILSQNTFVGTDAAGNMQVSADSWTQGMFAHTSTVYDMSASPTSTFPDVPASSTYISDQGNGLTLLAGWPGASSNIKFYTNGPAASNERMRIDSSGNVGIGTTNPGALLHVNGPMRLTPAALPASPAAGDLAFDSGAANALKFYNGSAWQTVGTGTSSGDFMKDGSVAMTGDFNAGTHNLTAVGAISGSSLSLSSTGANNGITLTPNGTGLVTTSSALLVTPTALPAAPAAGVIAFDSGASNVLKYYNGSAWQTVNTSNATGDFMKDGSVAMTGDFDAGTHNLTNIGTNITGAAAVTLASGGTSDLTLTSASGVLNSTTPLKITPTALPGTPAAGTIAFDSGASNALKFYDGSAWQTVGTGTGNGDFKKDGSVAMTGNFNAGGNSVLGNTTASANLNLESTSNATKGYVLIQPNGGNVGVGTTTPDQEFSVIGQNSDSLVADFGQSASGGIAGISIDNLAAASTSNYAMLRFTDRTNQQRESFSIRSRFTNTTDANRTSGVEFKSLSAGSTVDVMSILGGNVGIGTTSPGALLHVNGPMRLTPAALPASPAAGDLAFDSGAANALKFYDGSAWQTVGTGSGSGDFMKNGSVAMTGNFNAGGNSILGNTTASANLTLESTSNATKGFVNIQPNGGKVGIGTSTPTSDLHVVGSALTGVTSTVQNTNAAGTANLAVYSDSASIFLHAEGSTYSTWSGMPAGGTTLRSSSTVGLGIINDSAAPIKFIIGGLDASNEKARFDSTGNLGIGTTNPARLLHVAGPVRITPAALPASPAAGDLAFDSGAANALKFYDGSAWQTVGTGSGSGDFMKNGSVAMTGNFNAGGNSILGNTTASANLTLESTSNATKGNVLLQPNGGNVGIGTTSTSYQLHIVGNGSGAPGSMAITNLNAASGSSLTMATDASGGTAIFNSLGSTYAGPTGMPASSVAIRSTASGGMELINQSAAPMRFAIGGLNSSNEIARFDSTGNLGIGTNAPARLLHVNGAARLTPTTTPATPAAGDLFFDSAASNALKFYNGSAWQTVGTGTGSGDFMKDGSVAMTGNLKLGANYISNDGGASEGLAFDTSGNANFTGKVGIGTTTPQFKMHVRSGGTVFPAALAGDALAVQNNANSGDYATLDIIGNTTGRSVLNFASNAVSTQSWIWTDNTSQTLHLETSGGSQIQLGQIGGSTALAVNASGGVGIGTTTPVDLLSLSAVNASATHASLNLSNTALVSGSASGTYIGANPASASADFINYQVNGTTKFKVDKDGKVTGDGSGLTGISAAPAGANKQIQFNNSGAMGASANLVWDNTNGRLGIGTSSPSTKLEVAGGILASGQIESGGSLVGTGLQIIRADAATYSSTGGTDMPNIMGGVIWNTYGDNSTGAQLGFSATNASGKSQGAYISAISNSGASAFTPSIVIGQQTGASSYAERMRIDSNGNVGIGTASPIDRLSLGAVNASATRASLNLSNTALSGASASGTYIGANPASASADFINYQVNGTTKFKVDKDGKVTGDGSGLTGISAAPAGSNTQVQFNNSGAMGASANLVWDNTNGRLGIGTTTPGYSLDIAGGGIKTNRTMTFTSGSSWDTNNGNDYVANYGPSGAVSANTVAAGTVFSTLTTGSVSMSNATVVGAYFDAETGNTQSVGELDGTYNYAANWNNATVTNMNGNNTYSQNGSTGTVTNLVGQRSYVTNSGGGNVTSSYGGYYSSDNSGAGTTTNAYGIYTKITKSAGTISNGFGVYIDGINATTKYGLYQNDTTAKNYFGGKVGIGSTSPAQALDVSGNIAASGRVIAGLTTNSNALSSVTADFSASNTIRSTAASGACTTLNITNTTAGGQYVLTMMNATSTCTTIQWNGSSTNVKTPAGYAGGTPVSGVVYTFVDDGQYLIVTHAQY